MRAESATVRAERSPSLRDQSVAASGFQGNGLSAELLEPTPSMLVRSAPRLRLCARWIMTPDGLRMLWDVTADWDFAEDWLVGSERLAKPSASNP